MYPQFTEFSFCNGYSLVIQNASSILSMRRFSSKSLVGDQSQRFCCIQRCTLKNFKCIFAFSLELHYPNCVALFCIYYFESCNLLFASQVRWNSQLILVSILISVPHTVVISWPLPFQLLYLNYQVSTAYMSRGECGRYQGILPSHAKLKLKS